MGLRKKDLTTSDISSPIEESYHYNELERAMSVVFREMLSGELLLQLVDMFDYGTPWLGSRTVIERFTKLHGLAVLRRRDDDLADKMMAIILANWQSLASERGLGFLQFVLDMLYPKQNKIIRLWHSKDKADLYPNYLYETQSDDRFLTSRIRIKLDSRIDIDELMELAPVFRKLVPWHIVPEVAIGFNAEDSKMGMALVGDRWHVADFSRSEKPT